MIVSRPRSISIAKVERNRSWDSTNARSSGIRRKRRTSWCRNKIFLLFKCIIVITGHKGIMNLCFLIVADRIVIDRCRTWIITPGKCTNLECRRCCWTGSTEKCGGNGAGSERPIRFKSRKG